MCDAPTYKTPAFLAWVVEKDACKIRVPSHVYSHDTIFSPDHVKYTKTRQYCAW